MRDARQTVPTIDQISAWLIELSAKDPRCAKAAGMLNGSVGGRPEINDDAALSRIGWLLDRGEARSVSNAAMRVAVAMGGYHSVSSTAGRLARKYIKQCCNKTT